MFIRLSFTLQLLKDDFFNLQLIGVKSYYDSKDFSGANENIDVLINPSFEDNIFALAFGNANNNIGDGRNGY